MFCQQSDRFYSIFAKSNETCFIIKLFQHTYIIRDYSFNYNIIIFWKLFQSRIFISIRFLIFEFQFTQRGPGLYFVKHFQAHFCYKYNLYNQISSFDRVKISLHFIHVIVSDCLFLKINYTRTHVASDNTQHCLRAAVVSELGFQITS